MTRTRAYLLAWLLAFAPCVGWSQNAAAPFRIGTGKRDITPREATPMWGYAPRHDALSTGVLDPLYAAALVIQAGDEKVAVVGLDLGRAPTERSLQIIRERIKKEAGIEHSFIAGSHTHHGPVLELSDEEGKGKGKFDAVLRYYKEMEEGIAAAVLEANANLAPARMGVGSVKVESYNRNRQTKIEPKPKDTELAVMRFDDLEGKPRAVLINFAGHPTTIDVKILKFSADYVGALKAAVEKQMGVAAIFMQGAAGDLSVVKGSLKDHEALGQALAAEVTKLAAHLETKEPTRPKWQVREERFKFESRTDWSSPVIRAGFALAFFPELVGNYLDEYAEGIRPRLTVGLLNGEIGFVGASGEFFTNHSIRLKERSRIKQVFFFGYCNGYHQYFPTIEAAAEGGYGADSTVSPVAVGAGEEMMNATLTWIYQMLGKFK